jgi:uncharacterized protein YjbI with pentapeptide repeats
VADEEHVKILKQGVEVWNAWRHDQWRHGHKGLRPDLISANLSGANLIRADLRGADLSDANLSGANLGGAHLAGADLIRADLKDANLIGAVLHGANLIGVFLYGANLIRADLRGTNLIRAHLIHANLNGAVLHGANLIGVFLYGANLIRADLRGTNLIRAHLIHANLNGAVLRGVNLTQAGLGETFFLNVDLSSAIGLETCIHSGPSVIDHRTLKKSGPLPLAFLRGIGLPDMLIDYLPSLLNQAIQHYSCFISYSFKDQEFAERLHADLQNKGVRCWFAPHDLRIGKKILDAVDAAIRLRDRVLLILSEHSINSDWVEDEVTAGFEEERKRGKEVLFPIRLDDAVMEAKEAWAAKLRARLIGDFRQWKDHDAYQQSFQRMLRDLTKDQTAAPEGR